MLSPNGHEEVESSSSSFESPQPCCQFTFSEIQLATQNFDESLVIGRGGFGKVYKGVITNSATLLTVAIKRLGSTSNQGALEFWAEVKMLSKLRHRHLVPLIGYCNDGQEMILVYEYMSHGTLEDHLHKRGTSLTWMRRLQICIGAACGLDYLHTGTSMKHGVIHRDIKTSNILLDGSWAAKISDFGLSKIGPINQPSTYVSTLVKGTFGYLDPDYYATGRLTRKSDVFSFGVILFEVLCGKKAVDKSLGEEHWGLVRWVQDSIKEDRIKQIVDSNIRGSVSPKCLKEFAQLADRCLHSHPKQRPTVAQVVVGLENVLAIQEKANSATIKPRDKKIFGKKVPTFVFPSNGENSVDGDVSLKSLRYHLYTLQGENHILRRFDFDTIRIATENLSEENKVFQYRYISMYKGRLQNGQDIAIAESFSKRFVENHMREVSILVKCEHENLVKLLGCCIEGTRLFLVYELAINASLSHLLRDPMYTHLDWNNSGYEAPEYVQEGVLSTKADVYSLGVLVLETVVGHKMSIHLSLLDDVRRNLLEGTLSDIIDPRIDVDSSSMTRFLEIGLLCAQKDVADRPTMEEVVSMLLDSSSLILPVSKMRAKMTGEDSNFTDSSVDDYDNTAVEEFLSDLSPR